MSIRIVAALLGLVLLLGGCAFSPQQVTVAPRVEVQADDLGAGRGAYIEVRDSRDKQVLGSRGGVYGESSHIRIANDLTGALTDAVAEGLTEWGFTQTAGRDDADVAVVVFVDELTYTSPDTLYSNRVDMRAALRVEAHQGNRTFSSDYATKRTKRFVTAPDRNRNQTTLNQLLTDTLDRLFADKRFRRFVAASN